MPTPRPYVKVTKVTRPKVMTPDLESVSLADVRKMKATADGVSRGPAGDRRDDDPEGSVVRKTAGPADPATVRKHLNARLAEREPVKSTIVAPKQQAEPLGINPTRNLRIAKQRREDQLKRDTGY